jgi:hypothetical protein
MSANTQLTNCADLDVGNIMFSKPETKSIPNTPISYKRINIIYKNNDGSLGDLVIPTEQLFSFGLQENTDMASGKITGYSIPLCLWNRTGATKSEEQFITTFESIVEHCRDHLLTDETKEAIENYSLDQSDLKKFNPVYRKKDKGKIVEGKSPCLYPKLIISKKDGDININTFFVDENGEDLNPMSLIGKRMNCTCSIKIESIFVGRTMSLQVKVYECVASLLDGGMKRLLSVKPKTSKPIEEPVEIEEEEGSINGEETEEEQEEQEEIVVEPEPEPEIVEEKPKKKTGGRKKKAT